MSRLVEFPSILSPQLQPFDATPTDRCGAAAAGSDQPLMPGLPDDVAQLFRHSLRDGRIHPLMPLIVRYRRTPEPDAKEHAK